MEMLFIMDSVRNAHINMVYVAYRKSLNCCEKMFKNSKIKLCMKKRDKKSNNLLLYKFVLESLLIHIYLIHICMFNLVSLTLGSRALGG